MYSTMSLFDLLPEDDEERIKYNWEIESEDKNNDRRKAD